MANWADELIAQPMGFAYVVLFPRAREAIKAWTEITNRPVKLPTNVCAVARDWAKFHTLHEIDETGLAPGVTTQLYGYREVGNRDSELDLDPLMTGFFDKPCATSSIVSFGHKKMLELYGGAAFLTQDQGLAEAMDKQAYWPSHLSDYAAAHLKLFWGFVNKKWERMALWDRHLGDCLPKIKREQVVPWRVMRLAGSEMERNAVVRALRHARFDCGTNYPTVVPDLQDRGFGFSWGRRILNFFLSDDYDEVRIKDAATVVKRIIEEPIHAAWAAR